MPTTGPTTTTEVERKYDVPPGFRLPSPARVAGVARVDRPVEHRLDATYYDTADLRLVRQRITLRRRAGGGDEGWHLKRPDGDHRTETREPLSTNRSVPDSLASEVRAITRGEPLVPVMRLRTRRRETALRDADDRVLAVIADDTVTAEEPRSGDPAVATLRRAAPAKRWRELEVELVDGSRDLLDAVEVVLRAAGARPADLPSKFARSLGDRYPAAATPPGDPIERYLREQRDAIVANDPLVRAGDADGVHDMRVAIRRVRATLRTFRRALDRTHAEPLRAELHWLADLLGEVRDGDVLRRRFARGLAAVPPEQVIGPVAGRITERLAARTAEARERLIAALDGDRYQAILVEMDRVVDGGTAPAVPAKRLRRAARKALRRADARLDRADRVASGVPGGTPEVPVDRDLALHEARKAYKRARYAVELIAQPGRRSRGPARRLAKRLRALQEVLGDHQDAVVAARLLREYGVRAHLDGDNAFTYGLLHAREVNAAACHLRGLTKARRKAGRRKLRRSLRG
jgi:CHAD domain-containing protein